MSVPNPAEKLLQRYADSPRIAEIARLCREDGAPRIQIKGLAGALESFLIAASYRHAGGHYLVVATDKEEAAYIQNTIAELLPKKQVRLLPDSFRRPLYFEVLDPTNTLLRTETINYLTHSKSKGEIVVTYPEALFEQVVAPRELTKSRIELTKGEDLDVDTIITVLVEYGFKRQEFVYEPGQFSIRGGIIDIFSYGNEYPYRVELFDEEIESIRTFDPLEQRSVDQVEYVSIIPNINTKFEREQKTSIFEVLPPNTYIWMRDFQLLMDKLNEAFSKANEFGQQLTLIEDKEIAAIFRDRAFIRPGEVLEDVKEKPLVFFTNYKQSLPIDHTIDCRAKPQPSFNKNFDLLIRNLLENTSGGLTNLVFAGNPKQIERFYSIFQDLNAGVRWEPIPTAIHAGFTKDKALSLRMLRDLQTGDLVVHLDHGVGRFSGLEKITVGGREQESVRLVYKNNDILYVGINSLHKLSKYSGKDGALPRLDKIGGDAWKNMKKRTKRKMKDMAGDGHLQNELEASFIYEDTPDQLSATNAVKQDMMKANPMDRLICGDVGFGKTEIALRAAFKAAADGKQVAVLVPTTILALQHFRVFKERLEPFGMTVDYVNRFRSAKEKTEIYKRLQSGEIDLLIGTHAILSNKVKFKDLGLLVIDEEQKFGVKAKEKLRAIQVNVDTLTLTATPIPRTMQFSLMNARDMSVLRTAPPNRQPIHTEVRQFNEEVIKESIENEVFRGGQAFFVHNRVKSLDDMLVMMRKLCPDVQFAKAHGQMDPKKLEATLMDFIDRKYDVLICTNIIETGLDISNANTIIINNAHQFGLSDLHQLRGRVGRSNKKAFCYLIAPPISVLTPEARKRLRTLEEYSDLGSGFNIAMKDLDIRGAGNLLGGEQSGFISDMGYETYQRILEEAVRELKQGEFKDVFADQLKDVSDFVREVNIETDTEMLIPTLYVESTAERLRLYQQLDSLETEEELANFAEALVDRFGKIPPEVEELFEGLRLRWLCRRLGFERLILKNNKLMLFFIENPQSLYYESDGFTALSGLIASEGALRGLTLKQTPRRLSVIKENVKSMAQAQKVLEGLAVKMEGLVAEIRGEATLAG